MMSTELNILVVEDNDNLRQELIGSLLQPGWHVHGVDSSEHMIEWLDQNLPDIVLLDLNLSYEDGFAVSKHLRCVYPKVGIVMLTARVRPIDRSRGYESGVDVYLTKPTHETELMAVVNNLGKRVRRTVSCDFGHSLSEVSSGMVSSKS